MTEERASNLAAGLPSPYRTSFERRALRVLRGLMGIAHGAKEISDGLKITDCQCGWHRDARALLDEAGPWVYPGEW